MLDLSQRGCRVRAVTVGVVKGERVVVRFAGEEPVAGQLKRAQQASLGIAFDTQLAPDVLDRVRALLAPSNVVPLRRSRPG